MAQPYIGEIRMFGGNFAPAGWMFCAGQIIPISENDTLFQLIGTTYGGDGQVTFALPDLRSRVPIHQGKGYLTIYLQKRVVWKQLRLPKTKYQYIAIHPWHQIPEPVITRQIVFGLIPPPENLIVQPRLLFR